MYLYVSDMWGRLSGFMAAFFFLITPYRFATILVRANIGEAVSFAAVPLIFWGIYRLSRKKTISGVILISTGIVASLLSHVMVSNLFIVPVILYGLALCRYLAKSERKSFIIWILCAGVIGIGLSMYYILPAVYYQPLTVFDQFKGIYRNLYKDHFTPLSKLLYSPWGYGAIGSLSEMSRQVGLVIWIVAALSLFVLAYKKLRSKVKLRSQDWIAAVFLISAVIAIFMMMKESHGVWRFIEAISPIDFPWRFLAVTTFCGSML